MPASSRAPDPANIDAVTKFVTRVASMAHQYGTPTYGLESLLPRITRSLGYDGAFMALPRNLAYTFWPPGAPQPVSSAFLTLPAVSYDMDKLNRVLAVADGVTSGGLTLEAATTDLDQIESRAPLYPATAQAAAFTCAAAGFAVLLDLSWPDVAAAALLGVGVWTVTRWASGVARIGIRPHRVELVAAFAATCAAYLLGLILPTSNPTTTALCSFIILVPGLPLTLGVLELTEGQALAGLNRLVDGTVSTFSLFAGAALAITIAEPIFTPPITDPVNAKPALVHWLFVLVLMLGLTVVFRVVPRHLGWCVLGGLVAYTGVTIGSEVGTWQGPFLGAAALGAYASLLALATGRLTPLAAALPGVLVLVPGAAAYLTLSAFQPDDPLRSVTAVTGVVTQILAIVAGLSAAALFLPSRTTGRPDSPDGRHPDSP